jgi:hypothetical protein
MIKKIKLVVASLIASVGMLGAYTAPVLAVSTTGLGTGSTSSGALNCGATGNITGTNCGSTGAADTRVQDTIKLVIRIFQVVVGLISVFMIILGGLKYITSGGDSSGVGTAKNTILYAIIGLVVVALAEVVVQFVLNRVSTTTGL